VVIIILLAAVIFLALTLSAVIFIAVATSAAAAMLFAAASVAVLVAAIATTSVDAFHVDVLEVLWQAGGLDQHVRVLALKLVLHVIEGSVLVVAVDGAVTEICGLAVILAALVLNADVISVTLALIVTINLAHTILFLTFTFLTAVVCVPHLVKMMFVTVPVHTAALLDRHTDSLSQHKAFITHTSLHTRLILPAARTAVQAGTGGLTGRHTCGVVAVLWARRCRLSCRRPWSFCCWRPWSLCCWW